MRLCQDFCSLLGRPVPVLTSIEIIRPLHKDVARVRGGLSGAFMLVGVVSAVLLGLGFLVLVAGRR